MEILIERADCPKCKKNFEWRGYILNDNESFTGKLGEMIQALKDINRIDENRFVCQIECPECGHRFFVDYIKG